MKIGYGRVSTLDQNLDSQHDALQKAECDRIYVDKASGSLKDRPELMKALEELRPGDQLVVTRLNRLSRSRKQLYEITDDLKVRDISFVVLNMNIDTSTFGGRIFFAIMAEIAEWELENIREGTLEGLAAARKRGRVGGRKPTMSRTQVLAAIDFYHASDHNTTWEIVAQEFGVPTRTLHSSRRREGLTDYVPEQYRPKEAS